MLLRFFLLRLSTVRHKKIVIRMCFYVFFYALLFNTNYVRFFPRLPFRSLHTHFWCFSCVITNELKYHREAYFSIFLRLCWSLQRKIQCSRDMFCVSFMSLQTASWKHNKQFQTRCWIYFLLLQNVCIYFWKL